MTQPLQAISVNELSNSGPHPDAGRLLNCPSATNYLLPHIDFRYHHARRQSRRVFRSDRVPAVFFPRLEPV